MDKLREVPRRKSTYKDTFDYRQELRFLFLQAGYTLRADISFEYSIDSVSVSCNRLSCRWVRQTGIASRQHNSLVIYKVYC